MTIHEIINSLLAILAIFVSTVALVRARKSHEEFLKLEKIHAELSKHKLDEIRNWESEKHKANLFIELYENSGSGRFTIYNPSHAAARDIWFALDEGNHNPLVSGDYEEKIPYPVLNPGEHFTLLASFPLSVAQRVFPVTVRWTNEDGSQGKYASAVSR